MSSSLTCPASCPNSDLNLALMSSSSISICAPESQVYSIYSNLIKHKDTGLCRTSSTWLSTGSSISLSSKRSINDEDRTSAAKNMFFYQAKHLLEVSGFLWEHPQVKISILVRLKGRGNDEVFPRGEAEAVGHLPQVDEGLRASCWEVPEEELFFQVHLPFTVVLEEDTQQYCQIRTQYIAYCLRLCRTISRGETWRII